MSALVRIASQRLLCLLAVLALLVPAARACGIDAHCMEPCYKACIFIATGWHCRHGACECDCFPWLE